MTDVARVAEPSPVDHREELRAAHRHRQEAQQLHANAMAAERRGRALMQDAEHELAELEQQEAVDAAAAAERIAADIAAGQPMPDLPPRSAGWHDKKAVAQDRGRRRRGRRIVSWRRGRKQRLGPPPRRRPPSKVPSPGC
jgi:hypothetical protein